MVTWFRWEDELGILRIRRYNPYHAIGGRHFRKMQIGRAHV